VVSARLNVTGQNRTVATGRAYDRPQSSRTVLADAAPLG
jgi:hypothetical protein